MNRLTTCLLILAVGCGDDTQPSTQADAFAPEPDASADAAPPPPPSIRVLDYVQAVDITPDGRTAVFGDLSTGDGHLWFLDTISGAVENRTDVGDPLHDFATGIAQTGAVTAIHGVPEQAGLWTGTAWTDIPSPHPAGCDQAIAGAWDISADGAVVVGMAWHDCNVEAFRWSGGTLTPLAKLGTNTRPTVISDDGAIAAGWASTAIVDRAPARWRADGTGEILAQATDDTPGEILAIDADGDTLVGIDGFDGVVWGPTGKVPIPRFDVLLPSDKIFPNAVTADGATIFGGQGDPFSTVPIAFVWSQADGLQKLEDLVTAAGLALPANVTLSNVTAVSADGHVMIGTTLNLMTNASAVFALRL